MKCLGRFLLPLSLLLVLIAALAPAPRPPRRAAPRSPKRSLRAAADAAPARPQPVRARRLRPRLPRYRHYSTVEQLVARYGAKPRTKRRALSWLAARGLRGRIVADRHPRDGRDAGRSRRQPAAGDGRQRLHRRSNPSRPRRRCAAPSPRIAVERAEASPASAPAAAASASAEPKRPYCSILRHSGTAGGCAAGSSGGTTPEIPPFTPNQYLPAYGHAALHARGSKARARPWPWSRKAASSSAMLPRFGRCFGVGKPPPIKVVPVLFKRPFPGRNRDHARPLGADRRRPEAERRSTSTRVPAKPPASPLTAGSALGSPGHRPDVISISLGLCENEISEQPGRPHGTRRRLRRRRRSGNLGAGLSRRPGSSGCRDRTRRGTSRRCRSARSACPPPRPTRPRSAAPTWN